MNCDELKQQKEKEFPSSDDEEHHYEDKIHQNQVFSNQVQTHHPSQYSNLYLYFKEFQYDKKETFHQSKKDRKYSQKKQLQSVSPIKNEIYKTENVSKYYKGNQTIYTFQSILDIISKENQADLKQIEEKLLKNGFTKSSFFTEKLLIIGSQHSKYFQIVTLEIQISYYRTKIQILNTLLNNHIHTEGQIGGFGAFGNVYFVRFLHQNFAVKCIRFNHLNSQQNSPDRQEVLMTVINEYFFILFFSALQIGPKVKKMMGFDLIVSEECIQFSTEICIEKEIKFQEMKNLKKSLKTMHIMKIIHRDIKPDNIMYSESLKKHVFIDFGGCKILKQHVGEKTFTSFLGTAGFCTEQMFNLIGNSKSYVDLYYNDLYGLNKAFERQKQFSRNLIQKSVLEKNQNNIFFAKSSFSPFCLLNLIKHLIYNRNYNDFLLYWRMIVKKYSAHLDELQAQLLRFFMDLEPNETLKQFYWKDLDEAIRTNPEFSDLVDVFSTQLTDSLGMWKPLPSKQQKFLFFIHFYRKVLINHGNFTNKEKKILKILLKKTSIENYIFQKKDQVSKTIEEKKIADKKYQILSTYFLIVVNYCTFVQNKYEAKFSMKVKASQSAIYFIEQLFSGQFKKIDEMFDCKSRQKKHLVKMFQYFLVYFWQHVPPIFKESSMKNCMSSLFLLGYPIYLHPPKQKLGFHLILESQGSRVTKILRFWFYNLMVLNFGNLLYDRNNANFCYKFQLEEVNKMKNLYSNVMGVEGLEDDEFYKLNNYLYTNIYLEHKKLSQLRLKEAFEKLYKDNEFKVIKKQDLQKWRIVMRIVLTYVASSYDINYHDLDFKNIAKYNKKVLGSDINCLPFLFTVPSSKYDVWSSCNKLNEIIEIIDRIVNHQDISFRYFTNCRLLVAYKMKKYQVLKTLINLIVEATENFTFLNMFVISEQIKVVKEIVSHQVQRIHFSNFMQEKDIFDPLINCGLQMGFFYSDLENELNPLNRLKDEQKMNFKNFLMVIENLHLILKQIKSIFEDFLSLKSKKKNSPSLLFNRRALSSQSYGHYEIKLQKVKDCISNIVNKIRIEPYLANDRDSINHYVSYHMNYFINQRQFEKAQQVFQSQFGNVKTMKIDQQSESVKPSIITFIKYCILKTRHTDSDIDWYEKLLDIYHSCRKKNCEIDPFKYQVFYKCFFLGMIYCERTFQEIQQLLNFLTQRLRLTPTRVNAQKFKSIIQKRLCCNCKDCFKRPGTKWNPDSFLTFLEKKIGRYQKVKDSYMSFIFYYCLKNENISLKSKKKFIDFIKKSINHLSCQIRTIVTRNLHYFRLMFYNSQNGLNQHFQDFQNKMKSIPNLTRSEFFLRQNHFLSELKQKFEQKVIKKHIYFYVKHLKNCEQSHTLSDIVQRHFNYRQRLLSNVKIPQKIKEIYRKKLLKHHFIEKNYRPLYPSSQVEVYMHEIYSKR